MRNLFAILLIWIVLPIHAFSQNQNSVEGDRQALVDLYNATNGDDWSDNSGWLNGNPSSDWYGVNVDSNGRVIRLDLIQNNLSGELPESIGNLSKLQFFSVKRNPIYSQIPETIGNWENIHTIMFAGSSTSPITSNNNHPNKVPESTIAKYYGTVPNVFDGMPNLEVFQLEWSKDLDSQPFPSTLYQHPSIRFLSIHGNQFTGLEDNFVLPNLEALLLGSNNFSGPLPSSLGNSIKLEALKLTNEGSGWVTNNFMGEIPSSYQNLVNLRFFFAWDQDLGSEIPGFVINNWRELREFRASGATFSGEIPEEFGNLDLITFTLGSNNFTGSIPDNILKGMPRVKIFTLHGNSGISGLFPTVGFTTKTQLRTVWIQDMSLTGPLPEAPHYTGDMSIFTMHRNNFEGGIPRSWVNFFIPTWWDPGNRAEDGNGKGRNISITSLGNTIQWSSGSWDGSSISSGSAEIQNDEIHFLYYKNGSFHLTHDLDEIGSTNDIKNNVAVITWRVEGEDAYVNSNLRDTNSRRELNNMQLRGNELQGILPRWFSSEFLVSGAPDVKGNRWTHRDILENGVQVEVGESHDAQQRPFGYPEEVYVIEGQTFEFDLSHRIHHTDNVRWTKNGTSFSGGENGVLRIEGVSQSDEGVYRLELTNSGSGLPNTVISEPIELRIGESDGGGTSPPDTPTLSSPSNASNNISPSPILSWNRVSNTSSYRLQVSESSSFSSTVVSETGITGTQQQVSGLGHETTYYWRVRAVNGDGASDWSSSRSFTTESSGSDNGGGGDGSGSDDGDDNPSPEAPDLKSPADQSDNVSLTPDFEWTTVEGADYYILHANSVNPAEMVIDEEVSGTTFTIAQSLDPETVYHWRVRAVVDGEEGEWSPIGEFTTRTGDGGNGNNGKGPQKSTPAKNEKKVKKNATFTWESVEGAESYTIEIRESATSSLFAGEEVTDTVFVSSQRMKGNTEYTWRVRATIEGQSGDWSDEWEFTTEEENEETVYVVELDQNYPNPFNPSTNIRFTIAEQQEVSLKVYDMAGRLVASLVDGNTLSAGTHSASFNAQSLASGIYFYRLITPSEIVTRKMTLMK